MTEAKLKLLFEGVKQTTTSCWVAADVVGGLEGADDRDGRWWGRMTGLWIVVDSWLTFAAASHVDKNSEANRIITMLQAMFWMIVSFKLKVPRARDRSRDRGRDDRRQD